jgi:predicted negative regulator of RcsB-dependent stress response
LQPDAGASFNFEWPPATDTHNRGKGLFRGRVSATEGIYAMARNQDGAQSRLRAVDWCDIFFAHLDSATKEGIVGTTKLTRKEILAEDPVHEAIIRLLEFLRTNSKWIGMGLAALIVVGLGVFFGMSYLDARESEAQDQLSRGMEFFHAQISSDEGEEAGRDDSAPTFGSEKEKYEAAAKEFSSVASLRGHGKISIIARYYLGLTQLQLEQDKDAIENLKAVSANSRNRTLGFLAQKVLATHYLDSKNYPEAQQTLEGIIKDPQCDLPKGDLSLKLSRALVAQGKRDEAITVLTDATSEDMTSDPFRQKVAEELDRLQRAAQTGMADQAGREPQSAQP